MPSPTVPIIVGPRQYLTPFQLSAMLDVSPRTLSRWNAMRFGPPRTKVGRTVLYDVDKVAAWLAHKEISPVMPHSSKGPKQ